MSDTAAGHQGATQMLWQRVSHAPLQHTISVSSQARKN